MIEAVEFIIRHEGSVPHLYKDTRGNVTCGVGFLVPDVRTLQTFDWQPSDAAALRDWYKILPLPGAHRVSFYARHCEAVITEDEIARVLTDKLAAFTERLQEDWDLDKHPPTVQVALLDMAYNLGVGGLGRYLKLGAALDKRDYAEAATECSRRGVPERRNQETAELFLAAAEQHQSADGSVSRVLTPESDEQSS